MRRQLVRVAVAVLSGAGLMGCSGTASDGGRSASALAPSPVFVGFGWRLVQVEHEGNTYRMPKCFDMTADSHCVQPTIDFLPNGQLVMDDTVNTLSGHYRVIARGFKTGTIGTTLVGGGWPDATRRAGLDGIDALATTPNSKGIIGNGTTVNAGRYGSRLVLDANGYRLYLSKRGPASEAPDSGR